MSSIKDPTINTQSNIFCRPTHYTHQIISTGLLTALATITYYGRKKHPNPPIINTDNTHKIRRNFQRSHTLDWYCLRYMHSLAYRKS